MGRKSVLTAFGRDLLNAVRDKMDAIEGEVGRLVEQHQLLRGTVRVGGAGPVARLELTKRIAALGAKMPDVDFELHFLDGAVIEDEVREGNIDLGISTCFEVPKDLRAQPLGEEHICAVASRDYLERHGTPETEQDFREHAWIGIMPQNRLIRPWWAARFGSKSPLPREFVCWVNDVVASLGLAAEGVGIAVAPKRLLESKHNEASHTLQVIESHNKSCSSQVTKHLYLLPRSGTGEPARFGRVQEALLQ